MLLPISAWVSARWGNTEAYGYIAKENTTPFWVVQDIKGAESRPIYFRLTVVLLDCQVLLTDGLAYLWRGVPASTAVGSANLSYRTGFASRECESRRPPSFGMARRQQI